MMDTPYSRFADRYGLAYGEVLDCVNWLTGEREARPATWDTLTVAARERLIIVIGPGIDRPRLTELRTWQARAAKLRTPQVTADFRFSAQDG